MITQKKLLVIGIDQAIPYFINRFSEENDSIKHFENSLSKAISRKDITRDFGIEDEKLVDKFSFLFII